MFLRAYIIGPVKIYGVLDVGDIHMKRCGILGSLGHHYMSKIEN